MNSSVVLKTLSMLERQAAREDARQVIINSHGDKPKREDFVNQSISKYPQYVTLLITGLSLLMLVAAFTPSAIRLYSIGSETFGHAIPHARSMAASGVSAILMAETGMIVFSFSLAVFDNNRTAKMILYGSIVLSASIALVGNVQLALPGQWGNPFAWLEAVAPPLLTLGTSFVLKSQLLHAIESRHESHRAYERAMIDYQNAIGDPEKSPRWRQIYANVLRDALMSKNNRGRGKGDRMSIMQSMNNSDWSVLVANEMAMDSWYDEPDDVDAGSIGENVQPDFFELARPNVETVGGSMNGNGKSASNGSAKDGH